MLIARLLRGRRARRETFCSVPGLLISSVSGGAAFVSKPIITLLFLRFRVLRSRYPGRVHIHNHRNGPCMLLLIILPPLHTARTFDFSGVEYNVSIESSPSRFTEPIEYGGISLGSG